jgi:uncharacterized protein DUF6607
MHTLVASSILAAAAASAAAGDFEKDRQAILAMAGTYTVEFNFVETVALAKGYAAKPPKRSGATELVLVIEDSPRRIELQHILVLGDPPTVVKHWRQRWDYEDADLLEFQGHASWAHRRLAASQVKGAWTQSVFEVDDAPRYEGVGRWVHAGDSSSWESNETWRPLPRREYTTRDDYQVLLGRNRHTVTPAGWVHEQDNVKLRLDPSRALLVREAGLNRYTRVEKDLSAGRAYWRETEAYWREVRAAWDRRLAAPAVEIASSRDGTLRYEHFLERAEEARAARGPVDPADRRGEIDSAMALFVRAKAPAARAAGGR